MPRWREELARAGYPPRELAAAVDRAGLGYLPPERGTVTDVATEVLSPGGRLAEQKTFTRRDVIVAVAPFLHGLPVSVLDNAGQSLDKRLVTRAVSKLRTSPRSASTASAAAKVKPDANTDRRCSRPRSSSIRRAQLHSIEASKVLWRLGAARSAAIKRRNGPTAPRQWLSR